MSSVLWRFNAWTEFPDYEGERVNSGKDQISKIFHQVFSLLSLLSTQLLIVPPTFPLAPQHKLLNIAFKLPGGFLESWLVLSCWCLLLFLSVPENHVLTSLISPGLVIYLFVCLFKFIFKLCLIGQHIIYIVRF